ncbi:MAG TPA: DUF721 domain-containing protein [Rhizomicrobium sp.]|jgi:hypothetical protein
MAKDGDTKQTEQPPPRRNYPGAVAIDAGAAAQAAFARAGFRDSTIVLRWTEIAGPEIARLAVPIKLMESAQGGVLTLKAEPGAAVFLQHETRSLRERINAYLGRPAVTRLKFVQGPLIHRSAPSPRPARPASVPPDPTLSAYRGPDKVREALINLARARHVRSRSD